jgi:uncharacterized protein
MNPYSGGNGILPGDAMMCRRPSTGLALVSLLAIGIAMTSGAGIARAFTEEKLQGSGLIEPSEIPSVHNTFYQVPEGVVGWDTLGNLDVRTEVIAPLQARFHTDYSKEIKALDGREVKLMGFIYPLEGGLEHKRFLLTAWPPSCPFCLPAGPSQMVEVFCQEPVEFTEGAILMAGRFELLEDDPSGMYYRMQDAKELERYDDIRWTGQLPQQPQVPQ